MLRVPLLFVTGVLELVLGIFLSYVLDSLVLPSAEDTWQDRILGVLLAWLLAAVMLALVALVFRNTGGPTRTFVAGLVAATAIALACGSTLAAGLYTLRGVSTLVYSVPDLARDGTFGTALGCILLSPAVGAMAVVALASIVIANRSMETVGVNRALARAAAPAEVPGKGSWW